MTAQHSSCTTMLVGKKASIDGTIMIARNEDFKTAWPKKFIVHPHGDLDANFVSKDSGLKLTLPTPSFKYTATPEWTDRDGLMEEDGINEYHVAMSATESTESNQLVLGFDPLVKDGLNEDAMLTVVLPFVKTAREGVQRLGDLIAKYGSGESNGVLFADDEEAWYFENGSGHYWVAQRVPDDSYAVIANQISLQEIDFNDPDNFMFHPGIQKFVADHHLNPNPDSFNFRDIFGTHERFDATYNTCRVWYGHRLFNPTLAANENPDSDHLPLFLKPEKKLSVLDVQKYLSSHYQGTPYDPVGILGTETTRHLYRPISIAKTQESHVLQLGRPHGNDIHWLALGVPSESSYLPFFADITDTPEAYKHGRLPASYNSAYWVFKTASSLVDTHYHDFLTPLEDIQKEARSGAIAMVQKADQEVANLNQQDRAAYLTKASTDFANQTLHKYRQLSLQLIEQMTADNPLNFATKENL